MVQLGNEKEEQHANANKKERRSVEIKKKKVCWLIDFVFLANSSRLATDAHSLNEANAYTAWRFIVAFFFFSPRPPLLPLLFTSAQVLRNSKEVDLDTR